MAAGDAIKTEPVAAELETDDLLSAVGRLVDDLEEAGVQDVEAAEAVPAPVDHVAGMHHAALRREHVVQHLERVGGVLGAAGCGLGASNGAVGGASDRGTAEP